MIKVQKSKLIKIIRDDRRQTDTLAFQYSRLWVNNNNKYSLGRSFQIFDAWYAKVLNPNLVYIYWIRGSGGDFQLLFGIMRMKVLCHFNFRSMSFKCKEGHIFISRFINQAVAFFLAMKIEESTIFYWFCLIEKVQQTMPGSNNESMEWLMHSQCWMIFFACPNFLLVYTVEPGYNELWRDRRK